MSVLVNFYSANRPRALNGSELEILSSTVSAPEAVASGGASSAKDVDMLVLVKATSTCWVSIGGAVAAAGTCELWDAGKEDVRLLVAGQQVTCLDAGVGYETVAASQTDQVMGGTGAVGDFLTSVLIIPASVSPGAVSIKDGGGSAITIFQGGAGSASNLIPFLVPLGYSSKSGAWKVTTGASVSAIASGDFSA